MKRREFLSQVGKSVGGACLLPLMSNLCRCSAGPAKKQNVLFIILEDLNTQLGCYGRPYMHTPNIDRLAGEGILFKRAYVQQAVCAASRASLFTGLHPESTGVDYPYSYYFVEELLPKYGTLARQFFRHGYYTRDFSKIHHGIVEDDLSAPHFEPQYRPYMLAENIRLREEKGNSATPPYEMADLPDAEYADGQTSGAVISALQLAARSDAPFFFSVGFLKPHIPFNSPRKYWDLYERESIPLAGNKDRPVNFPPIAMDRYNLKQYTWEHDDPERLFSDDYARLIRHAYFACVSFIDAQIGRILNELDRLKLRENTTVIFLSDHGFHLGEQNHWGKTTLYEASLHVPLIVSVPGMKLKGATCNGLVEYVDIYPTLLDLAGIEIPDQVEGVSFRPLLEEPSRRWKRAALSQQSRSMIGEKYGFSMRTDRYRYTEWKEVLLNTVLARELYDLENDPDETINIAGQSRPDLIDVLSQQLKSGWRGALPDGIRNRSANPPAPPAYPWGPEGQSRRDVWHRKYGGKEGDDWRELTRIRTAQDA